VRRRGPRALTPAWAFAHRTANSGAGSIWLELRVFIVHDHARNSRDDAARSTWAALFRLENSREPDTLHEVLAALIEWLSDPEQRELRRSLLRWLREGFLQTRLPQVSFGTAGLAAPDPSTLRRNRRRAQRPLLEQVEDPATLKDLFENLLYCPDASAWLARLRVVAGEGT